MVELAGMRVCFIAGTLARGGAERQLYYIVQALMSSGAEVLVLSLADGEVWAAKIESLGARVCTVGRSRSRLVRLRCMLSKAREFKADVVQAQHSFVNPYAVAIGMSLGCRHIGAVRNDGIRAYGNRNWASRWLGLRMPHMLAVNSRAARENLIAMGRKGGIFVIPNAIDPSLFSIRKHGDVPLVKILCVSRLIDSKRMDRVIKVFARCRGRVDNIALEIAGDGPLRESLEKQAAALGISDCVTLSGWTSDTPRAYSDADIFLFMSESEGMPNVVMEAMAAGLPVVSSNVGGVAEIIADGQDGFIVKDADDDRYAEQVVKLVNSPELRGRVGARARRTMEDIYSVSQLSQKLAQLYAETGVRKAS